MSAIFANWCRRRKEAISLNQNVAPTLAEVPLPTGVTKEAFNEEADLPQGHRIYSVWSIPRWPQLTGIHIGPDTSAYHGFFGLGPNGKKLPFKSIAFKRVHRPSFAEARRVLIEECPESMAIPEDIKLFRWRPGLHFPTKRDKLALGSA